MHGMIHLCNVLQLFPCSGPRLSLAQAPFDSFFHMARRNTQGKYAEAEPLYLKALKISEEALGMDHPTVAHLLNNRATLLRDQVS